MRYNVDTNPISCLPQDPLLELAPVSLDTDRNQLRPLRRLHPLEELLLALPHLRETLLSHKEEVLSILK